MERKKLLEELEDLKSLRIGSSSSQEEVDSEVLLLENIMSDEQSELPEEVKLDSSEDSSSAGKGVL